MIVFVGDQPSAKNHNSNVPFIGTPSHKTLQKWIEKLEASNYLLINSHLPEYVSRVRVEHNNGAIVIALGNTASSRLKTIPHFRLPHPSPRNRPLNNEKHIDKYLKECKSYIEKQI